ncbi:MAG: calcium/sodium antiporter [Candidatus Woesearchaeota archaeon]|nr:calcium/sodium antiporter [Candidatus Woesearchaeota archaeon]
MAFMLSAIVLIVSLCVLVKESSIFTDRAEKIGLFFWLSPFIIGVTIVSIGTSLPELVSSLVAVFKGSTEIVIGNVVGSNIANICLVLALAAILAKKIKLNYSLMHVDLPLLMATSFLFALTIWDGVFSLGDALICLTAFFVYITYTVHTKKSHPDSSVKKLSADKLTSLDVGILLLSALFIYLGAEYTIRSVIDISTILNVGTELIAVTVVALGTSLPELAVTIDVVRKGKGEIGVGNVLGSNIFNAMAVTSIPAFFSNLVVPASILTFALPLMLMATLMLVFMTQEKEITQWEGFVLLLFYVFFIVKLFF